jgi:hypothetical protein
MIHRKSILGLSQVQLAGAMAVTAANLDRAMPPRFFATLLQLKRAAKVVPRIGKPRKRDRERI